MPRPARILVSCAICATELHVKPSRVKVTNAITCSADCLAVLRKQNMIRYRGSEATREAKCSTCSLTFTRKPSQIAKYKNSYCSRACRAVGIRGPRPDLVTGQHVPCERCGKEVWRTPATLEPHTFCSYACAGRQGPRGPRVARVMKHCLACNRAMVLLPSEASRYKFCSWRCANRTTQGARRGLPGTVRGERHGNWRGGISGSPYAPGFTPWVKAQIARRDGNRCVRCGIPRGHKTHVVHHIDGQKVDHRPANLVLLCKPCHGRVHGEMNRARRSATRSG